jgi:MscS family membrane protein
MDNVLSLIFFENTVRQWLISAAFIAGGIVAGKICSLVMRLILHHICRKTSTDIDDMLVLALERPLGIAVTLSAAALGIRGLFLYETARIWANRILGSLFIVILAWAFARVLDILIHRLVPVKDYSIGSGETDIRPLLRKFCGAVIWIIAGALILRGLGYDVSALLAGLGLGGAALALASKDTLANFFGSITVFMDRPFRLNDRIKIGAYEGFITEMGIRTSRLQTLENRIVSIPNSIFAANPIENLSSAPSLRVVRNFSLKWDNGPDKIGRALEILREICTALPELTGSPQAEIVSMGGGLCQVSLTFFVSPQADYGNTVNQVNLDILRRFAGEEIGLG